jgi:5'(3')-deoxyribonucleotidase
MTRRVFLDMDGVVVDFEGYLRHLNETIAFSGSAPFTGDDVKRSAGAYANMLPTPGALDGVRSIIGMGFDVWLATKPPTGISWAYADKAEWVFKHLPELKRKLIITHDKGMLGCERDILVDDRPHRANCVAFRGMLVIFGTQRHGPINLVRRTCRSPDWPDLLRLLSMIAPNRERRSALAF